MKKSEIFFGLARIPMDFVMIAFACVVAFKLRLLGNLFPFMHLPLSPETFPDTDSYIRFIIKTALLLIFFLAINKAYVFRTTSRLGKEIKIIFLSCFMWFTSILAYFFLLRSFPFSRLVIIYSAILSLIFLICGRGIIRYLQKKLLYKGIGRRNVLLIGENEISKNIRDFLKDSPHYNVISPKKLIYKYSHDVLAKLVNKFDIEEIIQTSQKIKDSESKDILDFCREAHIQYHFVPDLLQVERSNVEIFSINGIPVMSLKSTSLDGWGRVIKRVFDLIVSVFVIIIISPLLLFTAIAIKIDSKGPVLFTKLDDGSRVKRVGQKGELFNFLKFRSMKPNTHNMRYTDLAKMNNRSNSPLVKIKDDPRVTRFGRFIRKYSIDELPQLFNVLKGDLSLVGPRAHLPEEVAKYDRHHKFVLTIKPGITGLAQISGRSDLDFEEEVRLDTFYIENWSLALDIKILIKTVFVVLRGKGAD